MHAYMHSCVFGIRTTIKCCGLSADVQSKLLPSTRTPCGAFFLPHACDYISMNGPVFIDCVVSVIFVLFHIRKISSLDSLLFFPIVRRTNNGSKQAVVQARDAEKCL